MEELDLGTTIKGFSPGQKVFNRFTLSRILGRGGMGVVWLAHDTDLERDVALKFLPEIVALDRESVSELKRETRRNLDLTHPHIVRIYDFVQDARAAAISMEYINGSSLSGLKVDRPGGVFPMSDVTRWAGQLCEALSYAHARAKVVHRDLKPANLMVDVEGNLKITDFGIACSISDSVSRVSKNIGSSGTPLYMSPQQMMGDKPMPADDIYSLGATLFELLAGKPPFYTGNIILQVQNKVPPGLAERRQELGITDAEPVAAEWEAVIAACLQKDAALRPVSVAEVAERLKLEGSFTAIAPHQFAPPPAPPVIAAAPDTTPVPVPATAAPRSRKGLWLGAAAVLVVGGLAGFWLGDVPNRYKASQQMSAAQQALFASDWTLALASLRNAVTLRPTDAEYRREFDEAQKRWIEMVQKEIVGLDPITIYDRLGARAPAAAALVEPYSDTFRRQNEQATAAARSVVAQAVQAATVAAEAREFDQALARLDSVRGHAALEPGFGPSERAVRVARVRDALGRSVEQRDNTAYAAAYQILESVKGDAALVQDEYDQALQATREAEVRTRLAGVMDTARQNSFADALDELARLRAGGVLPESVDQITGEVRSLAENYSIARLARALVAANAAEADAAVSDYARFTDSKFAVTGADLVQMTELPAFVSAMENLRMHPAAGQPRRSGSDIALVAAMRSRFADPQAVKEFLRDGYQQWSQAAEADGFPGLALFLRTEAWREGAAADPATEQRLTGGLAEHVGLDFHWTPIDISGRADATLRGEPFRVLRESFERQVAPFAKVVASGGALGIGTRLGGPNENDQPKRERKSVRYQSGSHRVNNPAYANLQSALKDAQSDMANAQRAMNTAKAEANRQASNTTDPTSALASALAGGIAVGVYQSNYNKAANRASNLREQLRNTPSTLVENDYAYEAYDVITHNMTYAAELVAQPEKGDVGGRWSATLSHQTVEINGNASRGVPVTKPSYPDAATINRELAKQLTGKIKAGVGSLVNSVANASFGALERRADARKLSPQARADEQWSLVLLLRSNGLQPKAADDVAGKVRAALGLPRG